MTQEHTDSPNIQTVQTRNTYTQCFMHRTLESKHKCLLTHSHTDIHTTDMDLTAFHILMQITELSLGT